MNEIIESRSTRVCLGMSETLKLPEFRPSRVSEPARLYYRYISRLGRSVTTTIIIVTPPTPSHNIILDRDKSFVDFFFTFVYTTPAAQYNVSSDLT